jgi:hypothetical protein
MAELRRKNTSPFGRFSRKQPQAPPICLCAARVPVTCKSSADQKWPRHVGHVREGELVMHAFPFPQAPLNPPHVPSAAAKGH